MIATLNHLHKIINWFLGTGLLALILGLYAAYVYPGVGKWWTAIFVLSFVILGLLVTLRVTRKLYDNTVASSAREDIREGQLTNADPNEAVNYQRNLVETWRRMIVDCERKYMSGQEPTGVSFAEIFQRQPAFIHLVPLLSKAAIDELDADHREEVNRTERKRPVALRATLAKEISRIETQLKLFPRLEGLGLPQSDSRKLIFEVNKANSRIRVDETETALRLWLTVELRFENKDTYPVGFKFFDVSMRRFGIKDVRPASEIGIRFGFMRITSRSIPIELKDFEGVMIQERRLTPFYLIELMIAIEDDQIQRAEDLDVTDYLCFSMHSTGDNSPLIAILHPNWESARGEHGTSLMIIRGVPTIEMDYRRLR